MVRQTVVVLAALALSAPARAGSDDDDAEPQEEAAIAPATRTTGSPVAFNPAWLEPFFRTGPARQAVEAFRDESWGAAEAGFARAVRGMPRSSDERLAATYLLGLAKANQGKWAEAAALFEELHARYPKLAPYHAYNAARCRLRKGDAPAALEWAGRVASGTVPEPEATLIKIDALRTLGRWDEAANAMDAYLARFTNGPRRAEVMFKRAEAAEKLAARNGSGRGAPEAVALYRRVWAEAPLEVWAERAGERLEAIAQGAGVPDAQVLRTRTARELVSRAMVYFERNRNPESEAAFTAALAAPGLDSALECAARYHRAQSVWKQRQRPRAAPLFDEAEAACYRAGSRDLHAKALYQAARCYANMALQRDATEAQVRTNRAAALLRFGRVESEHGDHSYADDARLRSAEVHAETGDPAAAAKVLADVPAKYPKGDMLNEALWRLAFGAWREGRFEETLHWLDENLRLVPHEDIWYAEGRALYWKGRTFEKLGRADAKTWYERAVREYPLSVYALFALTRLGHTAPKARQALVRELRGPRGGNDDAAVWKLAPRPLFGAPGFVRAVELARMGQGSDARRELARLGLPTSGDKHAQTRVSPEDEDLLWITSHLLDRGAVWSASHSIPRYVLTAFRNAYPRAIGAAKWRLAYPRAFRAMVSKASRQNQVPEALQYAIMREESAFNPRIESFANAIGLTQLIIPTARRFANGAPISRETLVDPARNVEIGSRFLGFLLKQFAGSAPLAIAGYNAGERAVGGWLRARHVLALDEFLETIPIDETRNYTKRVLASYFAYTWLYSDDKPIPEIPLTLPGQSAPTASTTTERN